MESFFISPPRPKGKIWPRQLLSLEQTGKYIAQPKYNGDRRCAAIDAKTVIAYNRRGKPMTLVAKLSRELLAINLPKGLAYLDGEFLSQCNGGVLVLFDILYHKQPLVGVSQMDRLSILRSLCRDPKDMCLSGFAYLVSDHIWLAPHWTDHFSDRFAATVPLKGTVEGLLLRVQNSYLDSISAAGEYDVDWQLRCRQATKNYRC